MKAGYGDFRSKDLLGLTARLRILDTTYLFHGGNRWYEREEQK